VKRRLILLFIALLGLITAPTFAEDQAQIDALVKAQLTPTIAQSSTPRGAITTSDYRFAGRWGFGMAVIRAPIGIHSEPELRLFMARRDALGAWQVALEYTPRFYTWLTRSPQAMIPLAQRQFLMEAAPQILMEAAPQTLITPQGIADARLGLPFAVNQTWTLFGGPHGNGGNSVRPWSSLDLGILNTRVQVQAAREGVVWRSSDCPNFVRIDHADGWQTGYYHLINERVVNGQYVERGTILGDTSNAVGCGGWSTSPHVHFSLRRNGVFLNLNGHDIGGWTVEEGNAAYEGCMTRTRDLYRVCRPEGAITNDGGVGSGFIDQRYDYNRDRLPDLWAVNQRDLSVNKTTVKVFSGANFATALVDAVSGLPIQPENLNTAFAAGDYNGDRVSDLWVIHRLDGSEKTALRIMSGASPAFYYLIYNQITALPPFDNSVSFAVADYNGDSVPDLWAIHPRDPVRNAVSVQIVNAENPLQVLANAGTVFPAQTAYQDTHFAAADYNADGMPDLWVINPRDLTVGRVSVAIVSGRNWQTILTRQTTAFPLQTTDIHQFSFIVSDYNRDSYPDLGWVDRRNRRLWIVSGVDFTRELYNGSVGLPVANEDDWVILGSDRAREAIAPEPVRLRRPMEGAEINNPTLQFQWRPSGLATAYTLRVIDASDQVVLERYFADVGSICMAWCRYNTASAGVNLLSGRAYRWTVTAHNVYGSVTSGMRTLITNIPGAPLLLTPHQGESLLSGSGVTLTWQPRISAEQYRVFFQNATGTYSHRPRVLASACSATLCSYTIPDTLLSGTYTWSIEGINTLVGGRSRSEIRSLIVP
jgi:murein DD-endopeptidase MepM/ murein hydrolase activator NlpD